MAKLRVALIGCGGRGRQHAMGYAASDKVEIVACADPVAEAREALAKDYSIPATYADYSEMLAKEKPEVVSMCLWIGLHLDAIVASAKAGAKLINAEKPMAESWGDAKAMHQAAEAAGAVMTFSHQRRFGTQFVKARQLLKQGAIGDLVRMEGYCSNMFDWGTHWFDMLFFYNGQVPVEWVMGQIGVEEDMSIFGSRLDTCGTSYFRYENDVSGMLITGQDHGGGCQNRLLGTEGIIEVGGRSPLAMLKAGGPGWEKVDLTGVVDGSVGNDTVRYILDSIDCYLDGTEPELSSRKALMATELIFATYESARRRGRVYLPLDVDDSALYSMLDTGQLTIPDYPARLTPEEKAEGFELLFNGKDLDDWKVVGSADAWSVEKGNIYCNGEGHGWIRPDATFGDFVLRLQYRISESGNSGIFLRTSEEGRPAYQGMEIQILDDWRSPATVKSTGAIYDVVAPKENPAKRAWSWHDVEASCIGPKVKVTLNGKPIIDCDMDAVPELKDRLRAGFIGLQNHHSVVEFRSVRVKTIG